MYVVYDPQANGRVECAMYAEKLKLYTDHGPRALVFFLFEERAFNFYTLKLLISPHTLKLLINPHASD